MGSPIDQPLFGAEVDQHMAAIREAAWRWPDNGQYWTENEQAKTMPVFADERIARRILTWMLNPPEPEAIKVMKPGTIYLIWLALGSFTSTPPSCNVEEVVHGEQAMWRVPECDRCGRTDVTDESREGLVKRTFIQSFLLVRRHAWLFAFALCGACSYELGQDENTRLIRPIRKGSNG